jgi:Spy/CpxP family protein refolding chaperone
MKIIRKSIFVAFAALAFAFAFAANPLQAQKHQHHKAEKLEEMQKELGLSEAQMEKIRAAAEVRDDKIRAARQKMRENNQEPRGEIKAARITFRSEVEALLTPEQKAKYEALKAEQKDPAKRAAKQAKKMKEQLNLSDEQTQKVEAAATTFHQKMQALNPDTEPDEDEDEEMSEKRAERKALRQAFDAELKAIFTPEQYQKWQEHKAEKREQIKRKRGRGKK